MQRAEAEAGACICTCALKRTALSSQRLLCAWELDDVSVSRRQRSQSHLAAGRYMGREEGEQKQDIMSECACTRPNEDGRRVKGGGEKDEWFAETRTATVVGTGGAEWKDHGEGKG